MSSLLIRQFGSGLDASGGIAGRVFSFEDQPQVQGIKERMDQDIKIEFGRDLMLLRSHKNDSMLGKYPSTMTIEKRGDGLYFSAQPLETQFYKETRELVRKKVLGGVSAGFYDLESDYEDGIKVFRRIQLEEISLCGKPAYPSSFVEARAQTKQFKPMPPEFYV